MHAGAMSAYVFRKALLHGMADIQTAEIHSNRQGKTFFESARNGLHETP